MDRAAATRTLPGPTGQRGPWFFCSQVCVEKFDADPARWTGVLRPVETDTP
jgi:hypothetical protein